MNKQKNQSLQSIALQFHSSRTERDFTTVYNRMKPGISKYLYQMITDYDSREEVIATTFAKVWSKIDQYDPYWNFSTWVYRIARNEALLFFRGQKKRKESSYDEMVERGVSFDKCMGVYNIDCELDNEVSVNLYDLVLNEIQTLPKNYKTVLTLREIEKKKYEEIADELGWKINTVRTRIRKARDIVKTKVQKLAAVEINK
ncbi:sigma-70 family RNA polymerase sigma factor [bacterium]|nr:sigma-70 family RNA polymerase sigma factor [bacterium]